ncbi:MAG: hypothetical protein HXX08_16630 [Chloroflexi bacterium]|uniref:Roadblock/LAMTOR2 domain-containing protein n=1 Tax=Candidatus Chlorohelix allophototropha TaxID=3003348 RepID=A0A8T7M5U1_9CHLR|nr:hypothetical protein [Chloroflexota bacterium]WJW69399.1 hypothetical protein OZ401_003007 [Chloroflexota bacterium L227-S17]
MTFQEILAEAIQNVDGIIAASLVGLDGIGVDTILAEGVEGIDSVEVEVEIAGLVSNINRTLGVLKAGKAREIILSADNLSYLISSVDADHLLVFVLTTGGNLGRARLEVRRATQRLNENF